MVKNDIKPLIWFCIPSYSHYLIVVGKKLKEDFIKFINDFQTQYSFPNYRSIWFTIIFVMIDFSW